MCTRIIQTKVVELDGIKYYFDTDYQFPHPPPLNPDEVFGKGSEIGAVAERKGGRRTAGRMVWGCTPPGAPDRSFAPVNARSETAGSKRMFADAFRRRRCIVPVTAYCETDRTGGGRGRRVRIASADGGPILLAAIWNPLPAGPPGTPRAGAAVLTRDSGPQIRPIHHRQPVVLIDADDVNGWLSPDTGADEAAGIARREDAGNYVLRDADNRAAA